MNQPEWLTDEEWQELKAKLARMDEKRREKFEEMFKLGNEIPLDELPETIAEIERILETRKRAAGQPASE